MMEMDVDELITELVGSMPFSEEGEETSQNELYQLPVRHNQSGAEINEENKPTIVSTHLPGKEHATPTHPDGHTGIDLKAPEGSPVYSIASGVIAATGNSPKSGLWVMTIHEKGKVRAFYGHLSRIVATKGDEVTQDTIIGEVGETGNAAGRGAHLHFQVSIDGAKFDPQALTGKRVGSLSKKAEVVKRLMAMLDSKYDPSRIEILRLMP